jgi:hypothetical protein
VGQHALTLTPSPCHQTQVSNAHAQEELLLKITDSEHAVTVITPVVYKCSKVNSIAILINVASLTLARIVHSLMHSLSLAKIDLVSTETPLMDLTASVMVNHDLNLTPP